MLLSKQTYELSICHPGANGAARSATVSHRLSLEDAPGAYKNFHDNQDEWTKVVLSPN